MSSRNMNAIILPENMPGADKVTKPRAKRFTGKASTRKQKRARIMAECFQAMNAIHVSTADGVTCISIGHLYMVNTLNVREHWTMRQFRNEQQGAVIYTALRKAGVPQDLTPPLTITLTRFGPRELDDDGCSASFKHVRDVIAEWLGVDDKDKRVRYHTTQLLANYGIRIEITDQH